MAVTQSQIDTLNEAIANGERVVQLDGKRVEYRSIQELIAARNDLQTQLNAGPAATVTPRPRQILLTPAGKGY